MTIEIGANIKVLREKRGWSQEHLAQLANIDPKTVSRLEAGKNNPSPETRKALAQAFECGVDELIYPHITTNSQSKSHTYILEIYHGGECIEQRRSKSPYVVPDINDEMYVEFENPVYSEEHGFWWLVKKKQHLKFAQELKLETIMLHCEPVAS